ncbi:MAG: TRAP transporter small permease, partial [Butyricicoccus sp.]
MKALRKVLDTVLHVLAGVSFLAMVILTCWQVFTRYILGDPSTWSEELVGYLFAWMSLFGAALVTGERGHMNIPIIIERFGPGLQKL